MRAVPRRTVSVPRAPCRDATAVAKSSQHLKRTCHELWPSGVASASFVLFSELPMPV